MVLILRIISIFPNLFPWPLHVAPRTQTIIVIIITIEIDLFFNIE